MDERKHDIEFPFLLIGLFALEGLIFFVAGFFFGRMG